MEVKFLTSKKIIVLAILIVSLFAISTVSAANNQTNDDVNVDLITNDVTSLDGVKTEDAIHDYNSSNGQEVLAVSEDNEEISLNNNEVMLSSPSHSVYSVDISDTTISKGSGSISISIVPYQGSDYAYDFWIKIYDSNGNQKISKNLYSSTRTSSLSFSDGLSGLSVGTYTMKIVNWADSYVMDTATLTVTEPYPNYNDYSVDVQDTAIDYENGGTITMNITPSNSYYYNYYYYLRVYDSSGNRQISQIYYSSSASSSYISKSYYLSSYYLNPGFYTIKIENYYDGGVMDTATLTIKDLPNYNEYSVSVDDASIDYGSTGSIKMYVNSSTSSDYGYYYYLNVYDSNGIQKINKLYYSSATSSGNKYYSINSTQLSPGVYTVKIVNCADSYVMDNATLKITNIYPRYIDYSVSVDDASIIYGNGGSIMMYVNPSTFSRYGFNFYVNVFDSNGNQRINKLYYSTSTAPGYKSYSVGETQLGVGVYTVKIVNYYDSVVMDTATLSVKSLYPNYRDYTVSVQDTSIVYEDGGSIYMNINPSTSSNYLYDYYLNVFDSNDNQRINKLYYSTSGSSSSISNSYAIGANQLGVGTYTVKIVNYADEKVMATAKLTIKNRYPKYNDYSVNVTDTSISYENGGYIKMTINPSSTSVYNYYFYLKIFDSNGNQKISRSYYSSSALGSISESYSISSSNLDPGIYTIKIVNMQDSKLMDTATLTFKKIYPGYNDYSVSVDDASIMHGSSGNIKMYVSPYTLSKYGYNFYVNVFDSNGNQRINKLYYSTSTAPGYKYYPISENQLGPGVYTVKIVNYVDSKVMDTATLTIKNIYPRYTDYSISVEDTTIIYGNSGNIKMYVSPSAFSKYGYNFYVNVFDSNGNQRINKLYYSTSTAPGYKYYPISENQLGPGVYTVKIVNYVDSKVMDTAKVTVKNNYPYYRDYNVTVQDTSIVYEDGGSIYMYVSPSTSSNYLYDYYLNVFDSNGNQRINKLYYSTSGSSSSISNSYAIGANQLGVGVYTVKIVNYADEKVMDAAKLTIKNRYPKYNDYSVDVVNTSINYENGGSIKMTINPSFTSIYNYYFDLKIFDSNGNQLSTFYHSSSASSSSVSEYYSISSEGLSPGIYTMQVVNKYDNKVMDTATLTIKNIYPRYTDYSVSVDDTSIMYGSSGNIEMYVSPSAFSKYGYNFYVNVFDSNGNQRINKLYYSTSTAPGYKYYPISENQLGPGVYTVKIVNYVDSKVMDTATLTIKNIYPRYTDYSVSVGDASIVYEDGGSISMYVYPSTLSKYGYNYYFNVYDSNGNQKINKLYYSTSTTPGYKYYSISSKGLSPGVYTVKIVNYADSKVMDTATLTITKNYPEYADYSVSVEDTSIVYEDGGSIYMNINPSTSSIYKYYYYLNIYDSNGNQKISNSYDSSSDSSSPISKYYSIDSYSLSPGIYTMKLENYADGKVLDAAKLTIKNKYPEYDDYSVNVMDTSINYADGGNIIMNINPSFSSFYNYYFNLKIFDSNGNQKFSQSYYSSLASSSFISEYYSISSYGLSPGIYTVKIMNYYDNGVMDTATLTIENNIYLSDYSYSDLNSAISNVIPNSIIHLYSPLLFNEYTNSPISISKTLTIDGHNNVIDANDYSRIFSISADNVVLKNIIFKNAYYSSGGAILWSGSNGKLINCTFINNVAHDYDGGAVSWSGSYGHITGCKFINNSANDDGGAIYWSSSNGQITNCEFTSNVADDEGGAIYLNYYAVIDESNFEDNQAEYGGAIAVGTSDGAKILNSRFNNNVADFGSTIKWYSSLGTVTNCIFNNEKTYNHRYMYIADKLYPYFNVDIEDFVMGEKLDFTISLYADLQGDMTIDIFDQSLNMNVVHSVKVLDGTVNDLKIPISNLKSGNYLINVVYSGDNIFETRTISGEFTIS